jgi:hypothetical protein
MRNMRRTVDEWNGVEWSGRVRANRAREEAWFAFHDDYPLEASPGHHLNSFINQITEINNKSSQPTPTSLLKLSILLLNRHQ